MWKCLYFHEYKKISHNDGKDKIQRDAADKDESGKLQTGVAAKKERKKEIMAKRHTYRKITPMDQCLFNALLNKVQISCPCSLEIAYF